MSGEGMGSAVRIPNSDILIGEAPSNQNGVELPPKPRTMTLQLRTRTRLTVPDKVRLSRRVRYSRRWRLGFCSAITRIGPLWPVSPVWRVEDRAMVDAAETA